MLATDSFSWGQGGWSTKAGFELARRALNSRVEDLAIDPLDLSLERVGTFEQSGARAADGGRAWPVPNVIVAVKNERKVTPKRITIVPITLPHALCGTMSP